MCRCFVVTAVAVSMCLIQPVPVDGADIHVWTARAIATVLAAIGPRFERETGHRLVVSVDLPDGFTRRARTAESFDLLITGSNVIDDWIREGRVLAATRTDLVRSGIGVEVRAGAPKPDIGSVDALKRALLAARSIAYLKVGSGIHVEDLVRRLGIADAIAAKVTRPDTDIVSELVAKGDIELGLVVITQILTTPGVDFVGPLPAEVQRYVVFAAGISASSNVPDAARQLIGFLEGAEATAVIKAQGMEPVPGDRLP